MQQDYNRRAVLQQLGGNTGVMGNPAEVATTRNQPAPALAPATFAPGDAGPAGTPASTPIADVMPAAAPKQQYALEGYDAGKLASGHDSAKYQVGRTLQNFDPRQGITADALSALNGLGIGQFSGQGDKLHVTGGKNGFQGDTDLDVVRGFHDPNSGGGWQFGVENDDVTRAGGGAPGGRGMPAAAAGGGQNQGLAMAQNNLDGLLQGSPYANIQQGLSQFGQPNLQALLAQLGGAT